MKDLRTIILAAGKGTRMKSGIPKILHSICGKTLIQYIIDLAKLVSTAKPCVVLGHQARTVEAALGQNVDVFIQKRLLGTADAVKCALDSLKSYKGDILILCGDTPLLRKETIKSLIRKHKKTDAACTFLSAVIQDSRGYGRVIRGVDGKAVAIREETDATEYEKNIIEINAGVYCFKSPILREFIQKISLNKKKREYYLTEIIELLANDGLKISTLETEDYREGLGVNSREDLALCSNQIRHRILKDFMSKGVTIVDPQNTYIYSDVKIGEDTVILPYTFIQNNVRIGSHCTIGPFAHIRAGSKIGNNIEIGNFTEISRTQIGDRSFLKHFCFLGDTKMGKDVNVGAGVVTANFDGHQKNKTRVADQAFLGSDSVLVAPVKIGRNATTGAGCVVTKGKDIPQGGTVVGVPGKLVSKKRSNRN